MPKIEVCVSPALLNLYNTEDVAVVIIDVFRATSTITAAMHNGAASIIPIASVQECIDLGMQHPDYITAGERDGKVAPGLQHGNSPLEYTPEFISHKHLLLTTTNGTRLLHMVHGASNIIMGSFLNLTAVCDYLAGLNKDILLGCASWKDKVNLEDTLFAGAVVQRLSAHYEVKDDSARLARHLYQSASKVGLYEFIKDSSHYLRLSGFGLEEDIRYCLDVDRHPIVPVYNGKEIVIA
jgi:2-phosphosulfolactate phosphatase